MSQITPTKPLRIGDVNQHANVGVRQNAQYKNAEQMIVQAAKQNLKKMKNPITKSGNNTQKNSFML